MDKNLIEEILHSLQHIDEKSGVKYFSLQEVLKFYELCSFEDALKNANDIKQKLANIAYPSRKIIQLGVNSMGDVKDVFLTEDGLMFVLSEISKNIKDNKKQQFCYEVAKHIRVKKDIFYPERRILNRREYTETTKDFRSMMKRFFGNIDNYELSSKISLVYHAILKSYFSVDNYEELNYIKTGSPTLNYLDHITAQELRDLINIQTDIMNDIGKYRIGNLAVYASTVAEKYKENFYSKLAGKYPRNYPAHTTKPMRGLKDFYKILKEYKLDAESLNYMVEDFTKGE